MKNYIYTTTALAVMVSLNVNANEVRIQQSDNGELLNNVAHGYGVASEEQNPMHKIEGTWRKGKMH